MIGQVFNNLIIIQILSRDKNNNVKLLCKCICGNRVILYRRQLNDTISCGCHLIEKEIFTEKVIVRKIIFEKIGHGVFLRYHGKNQTVAQWGRELGLNQFTIHSRLARGKSIEEVLEV